MSNGRILDHHWVERTTAGQTAWRDSSMPMQERGLLSALRSSMKVSELYRKSREADPQAFLELVNRLSRRGWVARVDEPTLENPPAAPVVPATAPPAVVPVPVARVTRPAVPDAERPRMSSDLQAMLERFRGEQDHHDEPVDGSAPEASPVDAQTIPPVIVDGRDDPVGRDHRHDRPASITDRVPLTDPLAQDSIPSAHDPAETFPPTPQIRAPSGEPPQDPRPGTSPAERLRTPSLTLLDLLNEPVESPPAAPATPSIPPVSPSFDGLDLMGALDVPPDPVLEHVGPLTRVDAPEPWAPPSRAQAVTPAKGPAEPSSSPPPVWSGMTSLAALQQALKEPPLVQNKASPEPPAQEPGFKGYVFDHQQAAARLMESLQSPDEDAPGLVLREAVGEALPLHTLPQEDMIAWEQVDERQLRDRVQVEGAQDARFTYHRDDLVPFEPEAPPSPATPPSSPPPMKEARASDLGPKGPDPIEDDDLMQQLSRPRRLGAPSSHGTVSPRSSGRRSVAPKPRNDAFQQELQRMQAMKDDATRQEQERQDIVARRKAEEEFRKMSEQARRDAIAANRAEAQRREDAQSITNLSERMRRIKRNKDKD